MSTFISLSAPMLDERDSLPEFVESVRDADNKVEVISSPAAWSPEDFAEEQLQNLVRQLFLPGWPKASRQVLFCPVDAETRMSSLCTRIARTLVAHSGSSACVADAAQERNVSAGYSDEFPSESQQKHFGSLRSLCRQVSGGLWFMPRDVFLNGSSERLSPVSVRARLAEIRLEFDYTIIRGPAAAGSGDIGLLGGLCEGAVLVLQAGRTRRAAALHVKQRLQAANVRLLGTLLCERTFPVPQAIYQRF